MPSTVEQLTPSRVKITVEVPFAELKPSMDKAYRDIAKQVNIPAHGQCERTDPFRGRAGAERRAPALLRGSGE